MFLPQEEQTTKVTLWLVGDSTMSIKDPKAYPETGWGMPFVYYWDSTVTVKNLARNGRSTKSFIAEGLWQPERLAKGDYVFIQFGHNDASKDKGERYATPEEFRANLKRYVQETRTQGAIPILITPVARRRFDSTGTAIESHPVYADIVKEVAIAENSLFIDLNTRSKNLYQQMGPEYSKYLFNHLVPGEHPNYPFGKVDNTHFNELGARKIAGLVLEEIRKIDTALAARIVKSIKP
jgi:lysophospholipase L1-like esterase